MAVVAIVLTLLWMALFWLSVYVLGALPMNRPIAEIREGSAPYFLEDIEVDPEDGIAVGDLTGTFMCEGQPLQGDDLLGHHPVMTVDVMLRAWPEAAVPSLTATCSGVRSIHAEWFRLDLRDRKVDRIVPPFAADAALRSGMGREAKKIAIRAVVQLPLPALPGDDPLLDAKAREDIVWELTNLVAANGYAGVCLNPMGLRHWHVPGIRALIEALSPNLHALRAESCIVTDAEGPLWRDEAVVRHADKVLFNAFLQPGAGSSPAPLAPEDWFEAAISEAVSTIGVDKLRIGLGSFGYRWREGALQPEEIAFGEAMYRAARHRARIEFPEGTRNTRITFADEAGAANEIWLLDAASIWNQLDVLNGLGVREVTLWSAGLEDPGIWPILLRDGERDIDRIGEVVLDHHVSYEGAGPFLRLGAADRPGERQFSVDPDSGRIVAQTYLQVPRPFLFERYGRKPERLVALTFDDGPEATYTTPILDSLREQGIPATFFVVGANVSRNPDLARRMISEGHEIGSHTYFHPETDTVSGLRLAFELNALQRLLASVTGRGAVLYRAPYGRSEGPVTRDEAVPLADILGKGYIVAGADIVPRDWEGLTADGIVAYVVDELRRSPDGTKVIVLHDAGGDRSATAAALPLLIEALRAEGYGFTSLGALHGLTPDEVMPLRRDAMSLLDGASFRLLSGTGQALIWIFWVAILAGSARSIAVLVLAMLRRPHAVDPDFRPSVCVVIPAFNEVSSIERVVREALASDYEHLTVLVVDDGSTDRTCDVVHTAFGGDPRVTLLRQGNMGKWHALNTAYQSVESDIVVAVDADAVLRPDAIGRLVAHFADPKVGAVAGNVKVSNRVNLLTRLQALEYITAQNIDRRAAEALNAMLVVPGAIGAWRAQAVREAGLYSNETITEDADLTVSVLRQGYRVVFEPRAVSETEAPQTPRAFLRQRLRWTFGMMQTAWKHKGAAREARAVGLVAIPDLWLAGVSLGLLAPVADLVFLAVLFDLSVDVALGAPVLDRPMSLAMLAGYLALPLIDALAILMALRFERTEPLRLIALMPLQRLVYRPLLYFTLYRAVARAIRGTLESWGASIRFGTLNAPQG
jgi:peptidoglycan-N-acetylglucosamine deacetylase